MLKKLSCLVLIIVFPALSLPAYVSADLVNPDFATKHCKPGEHEITASYSSKEPFGPRTHDETAQYTNKSNYYPLTTEGHSFGGKTKFCKTSNAFDTKLVGAGVAGLVIISVGGLFLLKRRRDQ